MDQAFVELEEALYTWEFPQEINALEREIPVEELGDWREAWNSTQSSSMLGSPERMCGDWVLPLADCLLQGVPRDFEVRKRKPRRYITSRHAKRRTKQRCGGKYR
jgi:hypothetical protein